VSLRTSHTGLLAYLLPALLLVHGCVRNPAARVPAGGTGVTATLSASRALIHQGEAVSLSWSTSNATSVTISGVGGVGKSGSILVSPFASTSYTLIARGPNGTATGTASVTVVRKTPPASTTHPNPLPPVTNH